MIPKRILHKTKYTNIAIMVIINIIKHLKIPLFKNKGLRTPDIIPLQNTTVPRIE